MSKEITKVVITTPLDEQTLQKIKMISDRLQIDQVSPWVLAERKGDLSNKEKLDLLLELGLVNVIGPF